MAVRRSILKYLEAVDIFLYAYDILYYLFFNVKNESFRRQYKNWTNKINKESKNAEYKDNTSENLNLFNPPYSMNMKTI